MTAPASSRQFKKLYFDWDDIYRMPAPALKIWLYHYRKEGKNQTSWMRRETICRNLEISKGSLHTWREWLVQNGWLEKMGERSSGGEFSIPIFRTCQGDIPSKKADKRQNNDTSKARTVSEKIRRGKKLNRVGNNQTPSGLKKSDAVRSEKIRQELDCKSSEIVKAVRLENSPAFSTPNPTPKPSGKENQQLAAKKIETIAKFATEANPAAIVAEEHWPYLADVFPTLASIPGPMRGPTRDSLVRQAVQSRVRMMDEAQLREAGRLIAEHLLSDLQQEMDRLGRTCPHLDNWPCKAKSVMTTKYTPST
jgi:hypothetical protein